MADLEVSVENAAPEEVLGEQLVGVDPLVVLVLARLRGRLPPRLVRDRDQDPAGGDAPRLRDGRRWVREVFEYLREDDRPEAVRANGGAGGVALEEPLGQITTTSGLSSSTSRPT